jgi:hypothetical protein
VGNHPHPNSDEPEPMMVEGRDEAQVKRTANKIVDAVKVAAGV